MESTIEKKQPNQNLFTFFRHQYLEDLFQNVRIALTKFSYMAVTNIFRQNDRFCLSKN